MVEVNDKGFTFEELKELVEGIDSPERLNGVRNLLHTYKGAIRTRAQRVGWIPLIVSLDG